VSMAGARTVSRGCFGCQNTLLDGNFLQFARSFCKKNPNTPHKFLFPNKEKTKHTPRKISGYTPE